MVDLPVNKEVLKQDIQQFNQLPHHKKKYFFALIIILFIISLVLSRSITSRLSSDKQMEVAPSGTDQVTTLETDTPKTMLSLVSSTSSLKVGEQVVVSVNLSKVPVSAIDLVLNYDPEVVSISNVVNGDLFDRVLVNKIDPGQLMFSAAVNADNAESIKEGPVMTFTLTGESVSDQTTVSIDNMKTITALNGENTLGEVVNSVFTIVQ